LGKLTNVTEKLENEIKGLRNVTADNTKTSNVSAEQQDDPENKSASISAWHTGIVHKRKQGLGTY